MADTEEQSELLTAETAAPQEEEATREDQGDAEEVAVDDEQPAAAEYGDDAGEGVAETYTEEAQGQESELATDQDQQYPAEQEEPQDEHEYAEPPAEEEEMPEADEAAAAAEPLEEDVPADEEAATDGDIDEPIEKEEDEREKEPATDMRALEDDLTQFRHCIENIGTQLDDELNRQDMRRHRANIREKATRMENDLKDRQRIKDQMSPQERIHLQQVIKQLDTQLTTYHELLERERAMTRKYPLVGVNLDHEGRTVDHAATPGQAQAMLKTSVQDREHEHVELMELERDIIGLQDIQTDLATLIVDQADDVKLIEQNVERAGDRVEHGHSQMRKSAGHSRSSRKIRCTVLTCTLSFAAGVIIVLVIVMAIILTRE